MAEVIRMPLLSDTMKEGVIANWNKKVGDKVKSDEAIADVETDKATMEVIPYVEGTLLYVGVEQGKAAKVNDIIAIIGKEGEDISSLIPAAGSAAPAGTETIAVPAETSAASVAPAPTAAVSIPKDLTVIRMPLLSDTMKEGKIVVWNKQVGDSVKADDSLADVETDKATMEVIGYADGTLLYQGVKAGEAAKVNEVIAVVGKTGTDLTPYLSALQSNGEEAAANTPASAPATTAPIEPTGTAAPSQNNNTTDDGRIKASPLARQIAKDKGIPLSQLKGSGDGGRIVKRDVDQYTPGVQAAAAAPAPAAAATNVVSGTESHTDTPVTQMRKIIAQRLGESKFTAPHFYLKTSVQMDNLIQARKQINTTSEIKISINDMIIKAAAAALSKHPEVNSSWMGDFVRQHHHIHIGSAIALEEGLIVPVIRFANQKSLSQIAADATSLYDKARNKKIQPQEFTGNTFTISNLGMMDIDEFTAIINPPDACILAVGKSTATPVVENGTVVIRQIMKLTLSCDHRIVDGAVGARFLQTLKGFLENPITMLV